MFTAPRLHGAKREGGWSSIKEECQGRKSRGHGEGGVSLTQRVAGVEEERRGRLCNSRPRVFQTKRPLSTHPLHLHRQSPFC